MSSLGAVKQSRNATIQSETNVLKQGSQWNVVSS